MGGDLFGEKEGWVHGDEAKLGIAGSNSGKLPEMETEEEGRSRN